MVSPLLDFVHGARGIAAWTEPDGPRMQTQRALDWVATGFAVVQAALLLFVGLSAFGIWDPWELGIADDARRLLAGDSVDSMRPYAVSLVARGFGMFGVHEWSGRLPMAIEGMFALGWGYWLAARYLGLRAGAYTVMVAAATPLLLFNGRQMLGHTPEMAAQTFLALAATSAVFPTPSSLPPGTPGIRARLGRIGRVGWPLAMLVGIANAILRGGALPCALPPLAAVAVAALLEWKPLVRREDPLRMISGWVAIAATVVVGALVATGVHADAADYSVWVGGAVHGGAPPTFDEAINEVFHSFAPYSALLPLALGRLFVRGRTPGEPDAPPTDRPLRYVLALWAAFGYGAETLFESRYGTTAFLPLMALAAAVAILFVDVEKSRTGWWAAGVIGALLVGLVLRDFAIYPGTPIEGLGLADVTVPDVFKPVKGWALVLVPFALATFLSLGVTPGHDFPDLRSPYRFLQAQWGRGWSYRAWLIAFALLLTAILAFGLDCALAADAQGIPTLVAKWAKRLAALPIVIPALVALAQLTLWAWSRLGPLRIWPILVLGAVVGAYATLGYQRELSDHFSPRDVYDAFNAHARPGEQLAELRVGGRAATYYAHGNLQEMTSEAQLVSWLALGQPASSPRRWAAFPADQLPSIDRAYRQRTHEHLFVADARSARVILAASRAVTGVENQSFLARFVHDAPPAHIQHVVNASFQDQIELVGYDLALPHGEYVGAGEQFTVTWYWRCVAPPPGTWKIFLHVDGMGQRINGDHDPVDEKYPTHLWDRGDVVSDVQQLTVPANYRPGVYTFYIGFYSGESRLTVVRGPKDDANRVRAGDITVR